MPLPLPHLLQPIDPHDPPVISPFQAKYGLPFSEEQQQQQVIVIVWYLPFMCIISTHASFFRYPITMTTTSSSTITNEIITNQHHYLFL